MAYAKKLLADAGYPEGRDKKTGRPLILNYDVPASSGPDDKARFDWLRKQFQQLGIELNIRATQYNRFQQKMRTGKRNYSPGAGMQITLIPKISCFYSMARMVKLNLAAKMPLTMITRRLMSCLSK